tara:strand:+ start:211 stop:528 length:318 start_codon:yes stop_codon:yes gene_type:complete
MKSGEDVIADVQEMVNDDRQTIGYFLSTPCVVTLRAGGESSAENNEQEVSVRMHPWMPLAREKMIPISTDWVVTMITPVEKVLEMYKKDVLNDGQETDTTDNSDE